MAEVFKRALPSGADPVLAGMEGLPEQEEIYRKLASLNQTPLDTTALSKLGKSRKEQAERDLVGGLALQMLGGETLRPAGANIFKKALEEGDTLRVQTQDTGFVDPQTGEFVENPAQVRQREEKVQLAALDKLEKQQRLRAELALKQGNAVEADRARRAAEDTAATNAATRAMLAASQAELNRARAHKAEAPPTPKAIPVGERKNLEMEVSTHTSLEDLTARLAARPELSGYGKGPLSKALVAGESIAGGLAPQESQDRVKWWADFRMMSELPTRHALFGATLTKGEKAAFEAAQTVKPGTDVKIIQQRLADMQKAIKSANARRAGSLRREGKDPTEYELGEPKSSGSASDDDLINKYLK